VTIPPFPKGKGLLVTFIMNPNKMRTVEIDIDRMLDNISFDNIDEEQKERIKKLNLPGSDRLFDEDPEVAKEAARRFASCFLGVECGMSKDRFDEIKNLSPESELETVEDLCLELFEEVKFLRECRENNEARIDGLKEQIESFSDHNKVLISELKEHEELVRIGRIMKKAMPARWHIKSVEYQSYGTSSEIIAYGDFEREVGETPTERVGSPEESRYTIIEGWVPRGLSDQEVLCRWANGYPPDVSEKAYMKAAKLGWGEAPGCIIKPKYVKLKIRASLVTDTKRSKEKKIYENGE